MAADGGGRGLDAVVTIPAGWTRETWAGECERMAAACRAVRPDLAADWAARASELRAQAQDLGGFGNGQG